jgi:hypothetical protein
LGFSIADWGLGLLIWIGDWDWGFGGEGEMMNFKNFKKKLKLYLRHSKTKPDTLWLFLPWPLSFV